ncbi:hypothetical protein IJ670_04860 [bacterium]|nr:hypothetical protein [bacterium]
MNKDISTHMYNPILNNFQSFSAKKVENHNEQNTPVQNMEDKSAQCLYAMGCAKVNMDKRVQQAVEYFKKHPEKVKNHVDFCDELVKQGYNLETAVMTTDAVFEALGNKQTYKG